MAAFALPPWLQIEPSFFTQALEAGARTGLAVADQNQRAQQMAEQRAQRIAEQQQRAQQEAERQREFEASHLLNVQKVAQDAAQLAQQQRHQNALELNQQAQESRLLNYETGRLAVENRRAATAEKQATVGPTWVPGVEGSAPGHWETRGGGVVPLPAPPVASLPPKEREGKSVLDAAGNEIATDVGGGHLIPKPTLSPAQEGTLLNAEASDILKELDTIDMLAAARNPEHPKRARYEELLRKLDKARQRRSSLLGESPGVSLTPPAATNALAGRVTRDKDGKLQWLK